jgi:hypothetical protein
LELGTLDGARVGPVAHFLRRVQHFKHAARGRERVGRGRADMRKLVQRLIHLPEVGEEHDEAADGEALVQDFVAANPDNRRRARRENERDAQPVDEFPAVLREPLLARRLGLRVEGALLALLARVTLDERERADVLLHERGD